MAYTPLMSDRTEIEGLLLAVGYPLRAVQAVLKEDTSPSPTRFAQICKKLARGKSRPDSDAWERLAPSTWQGVLVRCLGNDFDGEFPPTEDDYEDAEAQRIAREGTLVSSADGAELFALETKEGWTLFELQREEEAKPLGSFAAWLSEGTKLASGST